MMTSLENVSKLIEHEEEGCIVGKNCQNGKGADELKRKMYELSEKLSELSAEAKDTILSLGPGDVLHHIILLVQKYYS